MAKGVRLPVRPTLMPISSRRVVACVGGNLHAIAVDLVLQLLAPALPGGARLQHLVDRLVAGVGRVSRQPPGAKLLE
jgi:hypothetical protein